VTLSALEGSRQSYHCPNFKQSQEEHAMQSVSTATGTPARVARGFSPTFCRTDAPALSGHTTTPDTTRTGPRHCLLPSSVLLHALLQAKHDEARHGRGHAYARLLDAFHQAILPAFLIECRGNLAAASRLLGLHRETVASYLERADIPLKTGGDA
ncbi:MAG: hypothetical protein KDI15_13115, partial [Thiothrix sp.]|nr:hypothetical protein [Thiothrix sp.]